MQFEVDIWGWQTSVKGQFSKHLGFVDLMASSVNTQVYGCSAKAALDSMSMTVHGCVLINLYLPKQVEGQVPGP